TSVVQPAGEREDLLDGSLDERAHGGQLVREPALLDETIEIADEVANRGRVGAERRDEKFRHHPSPLRKALGPSSLHARSLCGLSREFLCVAAPRWLRARPDIAGRSGSCSSRRRSNGART